MTAASAIYKKARAGLSDAEYAKTSAKKRADTKKGKQFSAQPNDVAKKTARHRSTDKSPAGSKRPQTRDELLTQARYLDIEGRSTMLKAELEKAVRLAS